MTQIADEVTSFILESDYWAENVEFLNRGDVVYHEINLETNLHPIGLEYLFLKYLKGLGRDIRNVGHAVFDDLLYLKPYTVESPIVNFVWTFNPEVTLGPKPDQWFTTWVKDGEREYFQRVKPRRATPSDYVELDEYFETEHWKELVAKLRDPEMEHFHAFLWTELHPDDLKAPFRDAFVKKGFDMRVPQFYLPQPADHPLADGRNAIMIGYIPDGNTSVEISFVFRKGGPAVAPKELSADERVYGGDGWTIRQYKERVREYPYEVLSLREANDIIRRLDMPAQS